MTKYGNLGIWGLPKCFGTSCGDNWVVALVAAEGAVCPGELVRGPWHGDVNPQSETAPSSPAVQRMGRRCRMQPAFPAQTALGGEKQAF